MKKFGVKSWGYGMSISSATTVPVITSGSLIEVDLPEARATPKSKPENEKDPALHFTIQHFGSNHHSHGWSKGR